ncbi:MAG TPA: NAD-dependent epimerase/dehydratase family protein [Candidatus Kryptonia bacterium]|nr:NAD-dependent epimerase/dehydratase family protein [Candidatus Kryptonia bacterium]
MKALVTGGAGFIGSHIADRLLAEGLEVRILDNLQPRVHPHGKPPHVPAAAEFITGDVRDKEALRRALRGVEVVFHQAAYQDYMSDFSTFLSTNAVSTALILEILVEERWPVRKVIVASSQAVYGEGQYRCALHGEFQPLTRDPSRLAAGLWEIVCPQCGAPAEALLLDERHHNPCNAYAVSKLAEELTALRLGQLYDIPTVALRYSITQGPRQSLFNGYSGICRIFCSRLAHRQPPIVFEDGEQRRDYVHIADVVDANWLVLNDARTNFQAFNVGSGRATTVREYATALIATMGVPLAPVLSGEYRLGDNRHSVSSIARLQALGWRPRRALPDIFDDYLEWLRNQGEIGAYFAEADRAMRAQGIVRQAQR